MWATICWRSRSWASEARYHDGGLGISSSMPLYISCSMVALPVLVVRFTRGVCCWEGEVNVVADAKVESSISVESGSAKELVVVSSLQAAGREGDVGVGAEEKEARLAAAGGAAAGVDDGDGDLIW